VADGRIFVGSGDGDFHAYALNAGNAEVYKQKNVAALSPATLHPNQSLKPAH